MQKGTKTVCWEMTSPSSGINPDECNECSCLLCSWMSFRMWSGEHAC